MDFRYDILLAIIMVSKKLWSKCMCIDAILKQLESMLSYFENCWKIGFKKKNYGSYKIVALEINLESIFRTKRRVNKKYIFWREQWKTLINVSKIFQESNQYTRAININVV